MNWFDILLVVLFAISILSGVFGVKNKQFNEAEKMIPMIVLILAFVALLTTFVVIDKASGSTIGQITSIDKNFFGTTALYIKTSETEQEEYCIEDENVVQQAKELIGKNVKIEYGTRVGFYSTGRCNQAPVEKIEVIK